MSDSVRYVCQCQCQWRRRWVEARLCVTQSGVIAKQLEDRPNPLHEACGPYSISSHVIFVNTTRFSCPIKSLECCRIATFANHKHFMLADFLAESKHLIVYTSLVLIYLCLAQIPPYLLYKQIPTQMLTPLPPLPERFASSGPNDLSTSLPSDRANLPHVAS